MPDPMTGSYEGPPRAERVEVITSVQRRRRWSTEEKIRIVEETYLPGNSVSLVARASWHRGEPALHLAQADGAGRADGRWRQRGGGSGLRAACGPSTDRELQRLLGKKTLENE